MGLLVTAQMKHEVVIVVQASRTPARVRADLDLDGRGKRTEFSGSEQRRKCGATSGLAFGVVLSHDLAPFSRSHSTVFPAVQRACHAMLKAKESRRIATSPARDASITAHRQLHLREGRRVMYGFARVAGSVLAFEATTMQLSRGAVSPSAY
jgi:hypothetical protein